MGLKMNDPHNSLFGGLFIMVIGILGFFFGEQDIQRWANFQKNIFKMLRLKYPESPVTGKRAVLKKVIHKVSCIAFFLLGAYLFFKALLYSP